MIQDPLIVAGFLAMVANRLVEALVVPLYDHFKWDRFTLLYMAWIIGGVIVFASGVNLFAGYLADVLLGQVLTAIIAGGGANLIADLFHQSPARP